jgi:hypothetical protein
MRTYRGTDLKNVIVAYLNFAKALNKMFLQRMATEILILIVYSFNIDF